MKPCRYCHHEVFKDEPGWGWMDDYDMGDYFLFHLECLQIAEEVVIA